MKKVLYTFLFAAFFCTSAFAQKNVAVLEIDRRPEIAEEITRGEAMEITGVIRNAAVRTLPHGQFSVMTSETVQAMGGAVLAECFDENCVIALGRTIDAEYVMRGVLSKFRAMFTLNIEMFETEYGNLVATSEPVRSENLEDLLNVSGFATVEMLEVFLARHAPTVGAQAQPNVRAERPARESRVREERELREEKPIDHFFAPKFMWAPQLGINGMGFNVEYGQVRGNGWFWSIDGGVGLDLIGLDFKGNEEYLIGGGIFNIGVMHEYANNTHLAYGGSVGLWVASRRWNEIRIDENLNERKIYNIDDDIGIAGAFIRYRYQFVEIMYKGLIGIRDDIGKDRTTAYISQLMLGLNFGTNRRR